MDEELREEAHQRRLVFRNAVPPILAATEVGDARDRGGGSSSTLEKNESHSLEDAIKTN